MQRSYPARDSYSSFLLPMTLSLLLSACGGGGGTNTPPTFTSSAAVSIVENTTAVMTVSADDKEGDPVTYSLTGSVDDVLFDIDTNSGALIFKSAPDYETPADNGGDNIYNIQITASDGVLSTDQSINITVTDVLEMSVASGGIKTLSFSWGSYTDASYYKLLVNPDGVSGYTQEGTDITGTSVDVIVPVHLTDWINASYLLEAYDVDGNRLASSDVTTVSSLMISSIGYFKASNTGAADYFGTSVALSGDGHTLAVGARFEDSATTGINSTPSDDGIAYDSGAVYLFRFDGSAWSQEAYIKASHTGAGDAFGVSVALSGDGNTLAVGAFGEGSATTGINSTPVDDGTANGSGAAYLFRFDGSNWAEEAYIKASNAEGVDFFGISVALSGDGNTLAVGAYAEDSATSGINSTPSDDGTANNSGAAYLFRFDGSSWAEEAYIKASNTGTWDFFGRSVSLSDDGNILAVGAYAEDSASMGINSTPNDDDTANGSGAAYLFRFDGTSWAEEAYIKASNTGAGDYFGTSVALSDDGNTLAVGAVYEDSATTGIDSPPVDDGTANDSGAAYLFRFDGTSWAEEAYIKASNTGASDYFGQSVALSSDGNTLAMGAYYEDSATTGINSTPNDNGTANDSGAVYLFRFDGTGWAEEAYIKASNTGAGDVFGISVALSGDDNTLAVGAVNEDSATTGINSTPNDDGTANDSGAVYLY